MIYAVLLTARKLRHYFEEHRVIVRSEFPLGNIINNKEAVG